MPMSIIEAIKNSADYLPVNTVIYRVRDGLERLYYSPGIPALSGYTQEEFAAQERENAMGLLFPADQAVVAHKLNECIGSKTGTNFIYRLSHKTKGYIWVHAIGRYLGIVEGYPVIVANILNISDEMMANNAILDSSDRFIALIDRHSRAVLYANRAFLDMAGTTLENCIGRPCNEVICRMGVWDARSCVCLRLQDGSGPQIFSSPNGRRYSMRCVPVSVGEHETLALYMNDITEQENNRTRIEQLQRDMTTRYQQQIHTIMKMNPDALSTFQINITRNSCGNGVSAFAHLLRLQDQGTVSGYFEDALKYIPAAEHSCRATFTRERCLEAFFAGQTELSADCHYLLDDNDERLIRTTLVMMENPVTHDVEGVLYTIDLEQRLLFSNIFDQLFEKEYEGAAVIHLRNSTYSLLQFKFDETLLDTSRRQDYAAGLARLVQKYVSEEDRALYLEQASLPAITGALDRTGVHSFTAHYLMPSGEARLKKISYYYLSRCRDTILSVTEDITDLTRKEQQHVEELQEALTSAEQATEARTTFLSNISHDMRTPLNGVLGFARLAREAETPAEKNADIDKILSAGDFLLQLINDTLDLSKIESNSMTLNPSVYDAQSIVRDSVAAVEELAAQKGVALSVDLTGTVPMNILVDKLRLQQVYVNLLGNAIKFTPAGGRVELRVTRLDPPVKGANYRVTIEDNGCGMSADFIPHAFEAYSQQPDAQSVHTMGTGLGLAIVKRIVTLMDGFIDLHSEEGVGTRFEVYLPIVLAEERPAAQTAAPVGTSLAGARVLVCEDHAINRELARRLLEKKNIAVTTASDGRAGLELFENSDIGFFDAILMDIRMPGMDGLTAAKALRGLPRPDAAAIPIIAMTANAFESDRRASIDAGMTAHLSKPINPNELYATLTAAIQTYRNRGAEAAGQEGKR